MADELTLSIILSYTEGLLKFARTHSGVAVDIATAKFVANIQTVGVAAEALNLGDITTPGYCLMHNLDTAHFVEVRDGAAGADVVKVLPGDVQVFRFATATPFVIADTAPVELEYVVFAV